MAPMYANVYMYIFEMTYILPVYDDKIMNFFRFIDDLLIIWTVPCLILSHLPVQSVTGLVNVLESYRGRDRVMRTLCYSCQLFGGVMTQKNGEKKNWERSLLIVASQLSLCRTVLRLFDDLAMLAYSMKYGLGKREEDCLVRWISVIGNIADQLYYPCEHMAWAADAGVIRMKSDKWWTASTALCGLSLFLGILRSFRILLKLTRHREKHHKAPKRGTQYPAFR
ncbi:peroxisomal membrane protein 11C-like [Pelobates fuscus]|uniref:peroxisomal membrane protein 11C-like n=1 Tax=Pelobates fuscus TaxID=191477 RepID=UPI002FE4E668